MASVNLKTKREIMLPRADTVRTIDDVKEFLRQLLIVLEDEHRDIHEDMTNINGQI